MKNDLNPLSLHPPQTAVELDERGLDNFQKSLVKFCWNNGLTKKELFLITQEVMQNLKKFGTRPVPSVIELTHIIKDSLNKESERNGNPKGHTYSEYCSCGSCHTALIAAQAIHDKLTEKGQ